MSQVDDVLLHIFVSTGSRVSKMLVGKGGFTSQYKANVNQGGRVDNQTMQNENDQNNLRVQDGIRFIYQCREVLC